MNIIQQPDSLSLSGNLKDFRIGTTDKISFVLKQGVSEILSQGYTPGQDGIVTINVRDIIHARLSYLLKETSAIYEQPEIAATFTAIIAGSSVTFRVIRAGVDRLADTATNFLTQNFLTWQPTVKPVTYYSPEFLTYYAVVACKVKSRAYFTNDSGEAVSQQDLQLSDLVAGKAYTIPLQYAIITGKCGGRLPAYYDVWVENTSGNRLTYIQRYYASAMHSEQEQWILFENSLGGLDTFRAYGTTDFTGEHTHNIAEIEETSVEYRVDTARKFQKNTGHLTDKERRWLLDFFPSKAKYIYVEESLRPVVVTDSNVTYTDRELPSNYTFTYKYADARPLLNLPRTDVPAEVLTIKVPSVGSFTVPPRLVEFPRLPLSEGALFPVQNPYSEEWSTATTGSLADFVAAWLGDNYEGGGGIGHKHENMDLLQLFSYAAEYLLVNKKKVKAGYADESGVARLFETVDFIDSMTAGKGGAVDKDGNAQFESLKVRSFLEVLELIYNRLNIQEGDYTFTEGGTISVVEQQSQTSYLITIRKRYEEDIIPFAVDDILYGIYHHTGGFFTSWMRTINVDHAANTMLVVLGADTEVPAGQNFAPVVGMNLARRGNFTNTARQSSWSLSSYDGQIVFLDKVDNYKIEKTNRALVLGLPKNLPIPEGLPINPEQPYLYARGIIVQDLIRVDYQGQVVKDIIDNGEWKADVQYVNSSALRRQDDVWWLNCRWRCVVEQSTIGQSPIWDSTEWVMVSGDKTLSLTLSSSAGWMFRINQVDTTLTATVWQGKRDITHLVAASDWAWARDSGDPVSDTAWNQAHAGAADSLAITLADMGNNWFANKKVKFTCTAYIRDGEQVNPAQAILNIKI